MEEGEPILGGPQAASGSTAASNVGPQPINPATPAAPSTDFSSFQSNAQPNVPSSSSPTQPISPARPQSVPRLTNRFSDRAALNQSSQAPLINSTPQNMQFVQPNPQIDSYASEIMSSPAPQPKKSKKWIAIILILLALIGIGVAAVMFAPTLLTGPVQEVTEEQYNEIDEINNELSKLNKILEDGVNNNLGIYELVLADYLKTENQSLNEVFINAMPWELNYNIARILEKAPEYISKLENLIDSMYQINYSADIKNKIQEIHSNLPKYSEALNSFIDKENRFGEAFLAQDSDAMRGLISDKEDRIDITASYIDFADVNNEWTQCISDNDSVACVDNIDQDKIGYLIEDTKSVEVAFRTFVNEEDLATIRTVNADINQLVDLIKKEIHEK